MEDDLEPGIRITVEGESDSGKTLVCNIINQALENAGFTNASLVDQNGEPVSNYEPKTFLDLARETRPEIFATPIRILEVNTVYSDDDSQDGFGEEPHISDDQAALVASIAFIEAEEATHY